MNIELHIERLVLEGVPLELHQRRAVQPAIEAELTRLLAERGMAPEFAGGAAVARLSGHSIEIGADPAPAQVGATIARAVHANLSGPTIGTSAGRSGVTP